MNKLKKKKTYHAFDEHMDLQHDFRDRLPNENHDLSMCDLENSVWHVPQNMNLFR